MRATASRPGAVSLRRDRGLLLLRSCQLFSGQRPRGLSGQEVAGSCPWNTRHWHEGVLGASSLLHLQGRQRGRSVDSRSTVHCDRPGAGDTSPLGSTG